MKVCFYDVNAYENQNDPTTLSKDLNICPLVFKLKCGKMDR